MEFLKTLENRRSIYGISKEEIVSKEKIKEIVTHCMKHVPSAFNAQPHRALLLFGDESNAVWDMIKEELRAIVPAEAFAATEQKLEGFKSGYGTLVTFIEEQKVKDLEKGFPPYAENFAPWSRESVGMFQFAVWTALEDAGLGANLQHYSNLIEKKFKEKYNLPATWIMISQMPFGKPVAPAGEKAFEDINQLLIIKG